MPSTGAATLAVARRDLGAQVRFRSMARDLVTADLADAWAERFESLPPVRVPRAFKGQRNFAGSWWFATTRTHVAFESWLERDHLMLWRVDDPAARPGTYSWSHVINGKDVRTPELAVKDDALHTVLRKVENGRTNWNYGDTYKSMGILQSVDGNQYVAVVNECTIVRR
jgi:hypothetical protein